MPCLPRRGLTTSLQETAPYILQGRAVGANGHEEPLGPPRVKLGLFNKDSNLCLWGGSP